MSYINLTSDGPSVSKHSAPCEHQIIMVKLIRQLEAYADTHKDFHVLLGPLEVFLFKELSMVYYPDIFVVSDLSCIVGTGYYGAPDFVIEVLTEHSEGEDRGHKLMSYKDAHVKECWIVDPMRDVVEVHAFRRGILKEYKFREVVHSEAYEDLAIDFGPIDAYIRQTNYLNNVGRINREGS